VNAAQIIARKRDGHALADDQIAWLIDGFVRGAVPDYQMSAWAMAVYLRGMTDAETATLTRRMLESGVVLRWSDGAGTYVDKHSCGGVGDKISLILAPLLACCGLRVPMISGRGLGATGGTLDKLESIPGFRTNLSIEEIQRQSDTVGCVITGATNDLAPADKKLYALRDVTATVASIPLITASIMSKKLAESLNALVLDVKFGSGAFMKTLDQARALARSLVSVGEQMGVPTTALLTDMNQPNGRRAGNAVEVNESLDVLAGGGPPDVRELTLALGAELLTMAGAADSLDQARRQLSVKLDDGSALEKFHEMVRAQGGDLEAPRPVSPENVVVASRAGYIASIDTEQLGLAIVELGGGRKKVGDVVDHAVGIEMLVRHGDQVAAGQPLLRVFAEPAAAERVRGEVLRALVFSDEPPAQQPLIVERLRTASLDKDRDEQRRAELIAAALAAGRRAYAPYSNFPVGAALLTADGQIVTGCNVENASYGLTNCAERVAVGAAVAAGHRQFVAMAVASPGAVTPCGACRQALAEFCTQLPILLIDAHRPERVMEYDLQTLLPAAFKKE
jgi:homotetrameric cytidine deaminase